MDKQIKLTDGRTAIFDANETLENIDRKLSEQGLARVKGGMAEKLALPVVEAASAVLGIPGAVQYGTEKTGTFIAENLAKLFGMSPENLEVLKKASQSELRQLPTPGSISAQMQRSIPVERAESLGGKTAQTVARNILMAPIRPAMLPATLSGLTEEALAFPFAGTPLEPTARVGGAMLGPLGVAALSSRTPVQSMTREEMARLTPQELDAARVMQRESSAAGVPVTSPEAIQRATGEARGLSSGGATRLPEIQRMIESSRGGGPVMRDFLATREGQTQRLVEDMFPLTMRPELGLEAQQAAKAAQTQAAKQVSQEVGPEFKRIESMIVDKADFDSIIKSSAVIDSAKKAVKSKPEWKDRTRGLPENSIGYIEVMRQEIGDRMADAYRSGQNNKASVLKTAYDDLKMLADDAVGGDYQAVLTATREARERIQRPLESTPIARIAETTQSPQQFAELFAKNAVELNLTPNKVKQTVASFVQKDPLLAKDFVNQYLRAEFDKVPLSAAKELRKGARFSENIFGNETQKQNLLAAYESVYGKDARIGFDRLLKGLKIQAERLPSGSPTAEKISTQERGKGLIRQGPFSAISSIAADVINGRDMERFAKAITSPEGVDELAKLASMPLSSAQTASAAFAIQRLLLEMEE